MLVNADLLPPHVMMVMDGCYYSLGVNGVKIAEPVDGLMRMLVGRNRMVVFVELTLNSLEGIAVELQKAFEPVSVSGGLGKIGLNANTNTNTETETETEYAVSVRTCLSPIRAFFEYHFNWQLAAVSTVFQLLGQLYASNLVGNVFVLNNKLPIEQEGVLTLPKYDVQTIQQHIQNLKLKQYAS